MPPLDHTHLAMPPRTYRENTITSFLLIDSPAMKNRLSLKLVSVLAALVIFFTSCIPKETLALLQPSHALGVVLADETAQIAGTKKRVVIITPDASWGGTSSAEKSFTAALKKHGFTVVDAKAVNVGDPMKPGKVG